MISDRGKNLVSKLVRSVAAAAIEQGTPAIDRAMAKVKRDTQDLSRYVALLEDVSKWQSERIAKMEDSLRTLAEASERAQPDPDEVTGLHQPGCPAWLAWDVPRACECDKNYVWIEPDEREEWFCEHCAKMVNDSDHPCQQSTQIFSGTPPWRAVPLPGDIP
jgi:hypothetical protein